MKANPPKISVLTKEKARNDWHNLLPSSFYAMSFPDFWQENSVKDVGLGAVNPLAYYFLYNMAHLEILIF
jgi:hypothetical protein